jgi:hypothetical protein
MTALLIVSALIVAVVGGAIIDPLPSPAPLNLGR